MSTIDHTPTALAGARRRDRTHQLLGQVMGLVAVTLAFTAFGAYLGRNLSNTGGLLLFLATIACIIGLGVASSRGQQQLAMGLLFLLGLLLGLSVAPLIAYYFEANPAALWQAAGATALFVAACGSYGYATRRDLSSWARVLFWALLALLVFGILTIFVAIPNGNLIYTVLGLVIFGGYTIFDFNRLRRANEDAAVMIACGIYLDIFNVFLFMLRIFGGNR